MILMPSAARADAAPACAAMASAHLVPPGDAVSVTIDATNLRPANWNGWGFAEFCEVDGHLDTEINFQVWLPTAWNGKILMWGTEGFAGYMPVWGYGQYATFGTDTGHNGGPEQMLNRPDRIRNFEYRAVHLTALIAKDVVQTYYGSLPSHSYFYGCSSAGGQGLKEAGDYPDDFDGVVAASPRLPDGGFWTWTQQGLFPNGPASGVLPADKVLLLSNTVLQKCGARGGVVNGIVMDPEKCNFKPQRDLPRCKQNIDGTGCFTDAQVDALQHIYEGPRGWKGQLGAGYFFSGGEAFDYGIEGSFTGDYAFSEKMSGFPGTPDYQDYYGPGTPSFDYWLGSSLLKYVVFGDPNYQLQTFNYHSKSDVSTYTEALAPMFPSSPDYSAFARRGGKLLIWHGWSDSVLNPLATEQFYRSQAAAMGGLEKVKRFDRLFLVPATQHCGDGLGPWNFDPIQTLEQWVEGGVAPDSLPGQNPYTGNTQPVCAYPKVAKLINKSVDPTQASSFVCADRDDN